MLKCPFAHGAKPDSDARDVMRDLKTETNDLHDAAEKHAFQHALVTGKLSREAYGDYLGQFLLLHRALDQRLSEHRSAPPFNRILRDGQFRAPLIEQDIESLGVGAGDVSATPAMGRIIDRIHDAAVGAPLRLLGYHYVLEGSNNGSRFIAKAIRKNLVLGETDGTRYLDPYGDEQPAQWRQFKLDMEACSFSAEQIDTLVASAKEMFKAVYEILDDLNAASTVAE